MIMKKLYSLFFLIEFFLLHTGLSAQEKIVKIAPSPTSTVIFPQNFNSEENLNFYYNNIYIQKNNPNAN